MRRVTSKAKKPAAKRRRGGKAATRRPWLDLRHPRTARAAAAAGLVLALGGTGWLLQSDWLARQVDHAAGGLYRMTAEAGFAVEEVLVEGRRRTAADDILAALRVRRGAPILALDARAARARLEALPWIRSATVERHLPRLLYIRLTEREPMAVWQLDGRFAVIDRQGVVIPRVDAKDFAQLPLVVGEGAPAHTARLLDLLGREPELAARVLAAVRVSDRRWNLRMKSGIDVRLPADDPAQAWARLARMEREHRVLQRDVVLIDLRLPGRLVVRPAPGVRPDAAAADPGRDT